LFKLEWRKNFVTNHELFTIIMRFAPILVSTLDS